MIHPFSFFTWANLEESWNSLRSRFPLPTLIVCFLTGLLFYEINRESESFVITRLIFTSVVVLFFSLGVTLFLETRKSEKYDLLLHISPFFYGIFFYLTINLTPNWEGEFFAYFFLHLTGFLSFVFFAPYLTRLLHGDKESFEYTNYFSRVSWTFLMSMIVGVSLMLLGYIAIASVIELFDLAPLVDEEKFYSHWAVIALALIPPLYALIVFPNRSEIEKKTYETNRFFSFLIRFIAVPFIYIYFLILYAYSAKVLMNFSEWPKGMISWMVIAFSTFGYIAYIFSEPYAKNGAHIALFRKYFPYAVVPQIFMLFYAIYLRIAQYDLTMNRYFVVIFGIWLLGISLYLIINQRKSLAIITASLTCISLLISVGPWSVYSIPLDRQYTRLLANLERAQILRDGVITPLESPKSISKELSGDIYSGISYVCGFSECIHIKTLFANELKDASIRSETEWKKWNTETGATYPGMNKWEIVSAVTDFIKVQGSYAYENADSAKYVQYTTKTQYDAPYPIALDGGYTKLVRVYGEVDSLINIKDTGAGARYPYITMNPDTLTASYHRGSGDILPLSFTLSEDLLDMTTPNGLDQEDLTFIVSSDRLEVKLYLQNFAVKNPGYSQSGGYEFYSINGIGLVKEK